MSNPLVSVIIPVFNAEQFIVETINSVSRQTYKPIEIIAVNDGSTDKSLELLHSFGEKIILIDQPNRGKAVSRNRAIEQSSGNIVAFLDADDLWDPIKIERQVGLLEKYPEAVATYCDHRTIDGAGNVNGSSGAFLTSRPSGQILLNLLRGNTIISPSVLMARTDALQRAGLFDEEPTNASEDYNLWLRLASIGPILYQLETLASYRRHDQNGYRGPSLKSSRGDLRALKRLKQFLAETNPKGIPEDINAHLQEAVYRKTITVAWQYRNTSARLDALKSYADAVMLNPTKVEPIMGMIKAFLPIK